MSRKITGEYFDLLQSSTARRAGRQVGRERERERESESESEPEQPKCCMAFAWLKSRCSSRDTITRPFLDPSFDFVDSQAGRQVGRERERESV